MQVEFADRAEIAFNSLPERDRKRVRKTLQKVVEPDAVVPFSQRGLVQLRQVTGRPLWVARVSQTLRMVVSITEGVITIEDIVPRSRLDRISGRS